LKQANSEIKQVILATKVLLDDWKKSIASMQRRDKALQSMKELIDEKNEAKQNLQSEIEGINKEIQAEQYENARLVDMDFKFKKESEIFK